LKSVEFQDEDEEKQKRFSDFYLPLDRSVIIWASQVNPKEHNPL